MRCFVQRITLQLCRKAPNRTESPFVEDCVYLSHARPHVAGTRSSATIWGPGWACQTASGVTTGRQGAGQSYYMVGRRGVLEKRPSHGWMGVLGVMRVLGQAQGMQGMRMWHWIWGMILAYIIMLHFAAFWAESRIRVNNFGIPPNNDGVCKKGLLKDTSLPHTYTLGSCGSNNLSLGATMQTL